VSEKITVIYRRPEHAGTPPTKAVMRGDIPMRTLDPKRLARAGAVSKPVRRRPLSKAAVMFLLSLFAVLVLVAALVISTSGEARAQTNIDEPWCQVSAPQLPADTAQTQLNCIKPRVFIPLVSGGRHESGRQSDRNHLRAADSVSVGDHDGSAVSVVVFCLLAGAGFSPPRVEMGWTLGGCVDETARPVGQATDVETGSNSAPTARVAGVEDGSGSLLR
jgi:hypothetical protein